ncbi:MAG: Serine-rich protein [Candidatus Jettenia ecosi]|uniref:Serine-rich protein n=1 Tax=Candidatus Jettenia ecosi TaxID=2494326 RepID=A0A533Q921_9BACT|nr:MAG: Serine-rich protein [Candidatus Jettenia ecosi]
MTSSKWIAFLRQYGPIPRNDNMYDETIQRSAQKHGIAPIEFEHPAYSKVIACFDKNSTSYPVSVILTGTAGDGKTYLCRQVWKQLKGDDKDWISDNPYMSIQSYYPKVQNTHFSSDCTENYRQFTVHFIRDLSGWAPQQGAEWESDKEELLQRFCKSLFDPESNEIFLIAANDGQLIESWRRLKDTEYVIKARKVFEDLLVEDRQEQPGVRLRFFNLSRGSSAELFDRAIKSFLDHPGWQESFKYKAGENEAFGSNCPIRHNYELLQNPLVQSRLCSLLELCDSNGLHVPIRQILLLLTNAILGHPDVKDHLMVPLDIPKILTAGSVSKASLFNNIFGGNLSETRRQSITVFDYFDRFQIGYETSHRIDNILIFGDTDETLRKYFTQLVADDRFYGADKRYDAAKYQYIEGDDEDQEKSKDFLQLLISQRRGLFFKIPKDSEGELNLWELTVFKFAGEYLSSVVDVLRNGGIVKRPILSRIVKGLNRIFTGMLVNSDREIFLATSGNYSQAKISRILIDRISVDPNKGEKIILKYDSSTGHIILAIYLSSNIIEELVLNLIRYEFLSRIALEGALPTSFSKECYEDILAFKSKLITAYEKRKIMDGTAVGTTLELKILTLSEEGFPNEHFVEIVQ